MRVYIDESGTANTEKIDPSYPVLVLGALVVNDDVAEEIDEELNKIKVEHFSDQSFISHSAELTRPLKAGIDPRNCCMSNFQTRLEVYSKLDSIIRSKYINIIFCTINLPALQRKYQYPADAYHLAYENILNRIFQIRSENYEIILESRCPDLDQDLLLSHHLLRESGTRFVTKEQIASKCTLHFHRKEDNIGGLQLIDLMLTPYVRKKLGKMPKPAGNSVSIEVIETKVFRETTFPK